MAKITDQEKATLMSAFGAAFETVENGKKALADLESQACEAAAAIVKAVGKGPHAFVTSDGRKIMVQFQLVNKGTRYHAQDITNL